MEYSTVILVVVFLGWLTWLIVYGVKRPPNEFQKLKDILGCIREFLPLTVLAKALQKWAETRKIPPD